MRIFFEYWSQYLICSPTASKLQVAVNENEYVIRDYNHPMGVATYKTADEMNEQLRKALPDMDEMRKLLSEENKD